MISRFVAQRLFGQTVCIVFLHSQQTAGLSAFLTFAPARMLQDARMAGLMKLRCGVGTAGEWPVWAGRYAPEERRTADIRCNGCE